MQPPIIQDLIDWHGCEAVQFDTLKLGGRATVGNTRMDADGILINYEGGLSIDEVVESFQVDRRAVEAILAFLQQDACGTLLESLVRPQYASATCCFTSRSQSLLCSTDGLGHSAKRRLTCSRPAG